MFDNVKNFMQFSATFFLGLNLCAEMRQGPHAQAPSVPIRRAGRRASDIIQILLYALRGEKSVIGGICNPSVAPHFNRWLVREVRSEFLWTADGASGRSNRRFAHFFFGTFFFCAKKKVHCPPAKGDCARRGVCAELECTRAPPPATREPPPGGSLWGRSAPMMKNDM